MAELKVKCECNKIVNVHELSMYLIFRKRGKRVIRFRCPHCEKERVLELAKAEVK